MSNNKDKNEFWREKQLHEMSTAEWESLCDGCGKCCLNKVEDEETSEIFFTNVACKLLDGKTAKCKNYKNRKKLVKECQIITPKKAQRISWLPSTCAYRLLAEGKDLPRWHHLVSGSRTTVHKAGVSVKGKVISEEHVKDLRDHIIFLP